ncbi:hypothetical protein GCM10009530_20860 [Microbispora corallina]|uniref:DUF6879 domain-containing protein n=1 Tax=Microbispora corallina TaxID=83302 RepID=A0ABQ4FTV4_9ACTN|nr:DUF6879 family protein [Microbispora corallina]GIH38254.1 hypothetical protein Mco01_12540 [Microbispora corallina]
MPGDAFEHVRHTAGVTLPVRDYQTEFYGHLRSHEGVVWKLERAQHFHEPDVPSWTAMVNGDWDRAVALIRESRFAGDLPPRAELRRLRVVETPLTPYMQWEIVLLAARTRAGERVRVLPAEYVRHLECGGPLPEMLILRGDLMYEVLYDEIGAHTGGRRITDPTVIEPCARIIADLYGRAEDVIAYHDREVAPLPPPEVSRIPS